ncbi:PpiC-type peptidyl-prolyl cis-trans isomerase [Methylocella silvestris BL2]|uniref:Parvulin-like PPIase n=1 Tax=Methylocella silvestris (strain DSM 15510 / CIP 108128 / LMG 27833 / NCIMB 13906 / BL2) TaxID=395965 RepID=B8EM58_METSB|nr:peptidylprolyl isomerase [Methylocella silvestris]ACK51447.1 PpiC-type peptidyl-prolyl cis-trans isomerase [Methylocella silvestris BL2]
MFAKTHLRATAAGLACALALATPALVSAETAKSEAGKSEAAKTAASAAASSAKPKVLATVNGQEITENDLAIAKDDLAGSLPQQLQGKARDTYVVDFLIDGALVSQKAKADKLDATPEFAKKLAYYHEKLLMETLLGQVAKAALTDEAIKKTYDDALKAQKPETEVHARHILVATDADAEAVLKRLKAGEEFAKVAKEVSKDTSADGGDLGWFTKDKMVPEFAEAAFKLEPGQLSAPVKSPFGWHIILVEGKREKPFPALDEVKDQVSRYVVQKAQGELVAGLRKDAKIERAEPEVDPDAKGAESPADAAAPAPAPAEGKKK